MTMKIAPTVVSDPVVRREIIREVLGDAIAHPGEFDLPEVEITANRYSTNSTAGAVIGGNNGAQFVGVVLAVVSDIVVLYGHVAGGAHARDTFVIPTSAIMDVTVP